ncbi:MAG: S-layer homology domain-containing protein [Clostridium sp.]|nr:S-layer homology domain-containing protein [Clostridium sp.]
MLKKTLLYMLFVSVIFFNNHTVGVMAKAGSNGYEGGISSGESPGKNSFEYKEVCLITGEPIIFEGMLTVKKTLKQDKATGGNIITENYTYSLQNVQNGATLSRFVSYNTLLTKKENGQVIEETNLNARCTEVVRVGNTTYTLSNYDFTKTNIVDPQPAVDYFAGNMWGRKTYQVNGGANAGTVIVEVSGNFYGYNHFWGNTETQVLDYIIQGEKKDSDELDRWGGTANIKLSSSISKQISYIQNEPETISFEGGFVQNQYNSRILQYTANLPEFDFKGVSTDRLVEARDRLGLEGFPVSKRLLVPNLNHIRGHWAENDIKALYSLEVFTEDQQNFDPAQIMTRAEFADAIILALKDVPKDPLLVESRTSASKTNKKEEEKVSPFMDVPTDSKYFGSIESAYKRGMISGRGYNIFAPDDYLTTADAITIIINALGIEGLAPSMGVVTTFRDDDTIPQYAKRAVYVAQRIGLILGDERGYLKPSEHITKARAAVIINKLINYMRNDLKQDYRERIVNY